MNDGNTGSPKGSCQDNSALSGSDAGATNVVRVPFGVRRARRSRPQRPDHWATLVLPFQAVGGGGPNPPQAA